MKALKLIPLVLALAGCSSGGSSEGEVIQQDAETVVVESDQEETARLEGYFKSAFNDGEVWECIRIEIRLTGSNNIHRYLSNWNNWAFSFDPETRQLISYTDVAQTLNGANMTLRSTLKFNKGHYFRQLVMSPETPDLHWFDDYPIFSIRFADEKTIFGFIGDYDLGGNTDVRCTAREYSVVTVVDELISTLPAY